MFDVIIAGTWVLVVNGIDQGASCRHLFSAFPEAEALSGTDVGAVGEVVGVGGRGAGEFFGEVVLVAVAESGAPVGECVFEFIELIATA